MQPQRRLIDLSIYLENDVLSDPPSLAPRITYQKHADTLPEFLAMLPGTKPQDYPDGEAAAAERVTTRQSARGQRDAAQEAVADDGLLGVGRA